LDQSGQMDMQQLLAAAQQMQHQLMNAQQELADAEVEGTAGGGLVTATVNGQGELVDLTISAAAVDVTDPAEAAQAVADLVLAAVRDAYRAAGELQQEKMGPLAALGGGGPGEVPGLSEFFGGAGSGDTGSEGAAPTGGAAPAGGTAPASGTALGGGVTPGGDEPEGTVRD
jgi:DNA-binding YbaB/EbfC family protein